MIESSPKIEKEPLDLEDIYFEESMEDNFCGFGSREEREKTAREYEVIGEGILGFYKVNNRVYYKKTQKILEPIEYWFKKDKQLRENKDRDYYLKGNW